jgi:hypothetical protein
MVKRMNEFQAWQKILEEWKQVKRVKKLNQELYDILFGAIAYIIEYSKKYGVPISKKDEMKRMADRIHYLMDEIEGPADEILHSNKNGKTDGDFTEPEIITLIKVNRL